jgi:hypothetical protein
MSDELKVITGDEKRALLMEGLKLSGWPDDVATEVVDLAMHACSESLKTMVRITETGSKEIIRLQAMLIAGELITGKLQLAQQDIDEDAETFASIEELRERAK